MDEYIRPADEVISTGISGLDDILRGGLTPGRIYLLEGNPGSGKTTLALQFLLEGLRRGEPTFYVTLSESKQELVAVARSHGWAIDDIHIHEMAVPDQNLSPESQLTMFHPSELELNETVREVLLDVEKYKPKRIVFDSLSEMRLMAQNPLRYRRQILSLKQFFIGRQATVLLVDDRTAPGEDLQLQSIVHGVIRLDQVETGYGAERRRLIVRKMRGIQFRGGLHDFVIRKGGLDIFPRLVAAEHTADFAREALLSGLPELDKLLSGGLPPGSTTLFIGPAGAGKSSAALQFVIAAANRGERGAVFIFDETVGILRRRARSLGMPLDRHIDAGLISVQQIDPAELSPGEFTAAIRRAVDGQDASGHLAKVIMIDSLNGYLHSMSEERQLSAQLHELFTFLNQRGINTLFTVTQSGMVGNSVQSPVDTTYLADNVILFRYFEARGYIRRAISIVKKRSGPHEQSIREMRMGPGGIEVGQPLTDFEGILTGIPTYVGVADNLMNPRAPSPGGRS